jgi:ABC-2 type transport system permease protein
MDEKAPNKITLILRKEWLELRQQRALLLGTILPPLFFTLIPIAMLYATSHIPMSVFKANDTKEISDAIARVNPAFANMTPLESAQALLGQQLSVLFLFLPAILPSIIASYSVVGEKTSRTLEPVLATPVTTTQLMVAKSLTALIPAVVITWVCASIFITSVWVLAVSHRVFVAIISPGWLIVLFVGGPLLGLITVGATVAVSSRVNDPRTAQQISVVVILPIMMLFFGQFTGLLVLSPTVALFGLVGLALLAAIVLAIAIRVFQRETILTRWT